jgi:hypothetical protein
MLRKRVHAGEQHCKVQKNGVVTLAGGSTLYYYCSTLYWVCVLHLSALSGPLYNYEAFLFLKLPKASSARRLLPY